MEAVHLFFKSTLPAFLKGLPIPKQFSGFAKLSGDEWMQLVPFFCVVGFLIYATLKLLFTRKREPKVNLTQRKEELKVVDQFQIKDIEDIGDNIALCRCWRSKKFPLCDGSHNRHNATARDNVGPVMILVKSDDKKEK